MKKTSRFCILFLAFYFLSKCNSSKTDKITSNSISKVETIDQESIDPNPKIAEYIRNFIQDKNGHYWMGTNGYGVAHYNGNSISYYSTKQGFGGEQITGIDEDLDGNIWFGTNLGVVKYSFESDKKGNMIFDNYSVAPFYEGNNVRSLFVDGKGTVWVGTMEGVRRFNGFHFDFFGEPVKNQSSKDSLYKQIVWGLAEDNDGNMWFGTSNAGAFRFDGREFMHFGMDDGLSDNSIDQILQDSKGNIWFGTRFGGANCYNGETFKHYNMKEGSIKNDEVCVIFEDSKGDIWLSSEGYGVYRISGDGITNYGEKDGLMVRAVQTIYEDKQGRLFAGGGGGLYRLLADKFIHVGKNGPWD